MLIAGNRQHAGPIMPELPCRSCMPPCRCGVSLATANAYGPRRSGPARAQARSTRDRGRQDGRMERSRGPPAEPVAIVKRRTGTERSGRLR